MTKTMTTSKAMITLAILLSSFSASAKDVEKCDSDPMYCMGEVVITEIPVEVDSPQLKGMFSDDEDQERRDQSVNSSLERTLGVMLSRTQQLVAFGEVVYDLVRKGEPVLTEEYRAISVLPRIDGTGPEDRQVGQAFGGSRSLRGFGDVAGDSPGNPYPGGIGGTGPDTIPPDNRYPMPMPMPIPTPEPQNREVLASALQDMSGWKEPVIRAYRYQWKNLIGRPVIDFTFHIIAVPGGKYKGRGEYLTGVQIVPSNVLVKFGQIFDVRMKLDTTYNVGSDEQPVAAAILTLENKLDTVFHISKKSFRQSFIVKGDGTIRQLF